MKLRYGLTPEAIDGFEEQAHAQDSSASRHSAGLSDELGDRLLIYDNSSAPTLELLRFRRTLTAMPGFEVALRRRVERLSHLRHPSFVDCYTDFGSPGGLISDSSTASDVSAQRSSTSW